jgi:hypothetical protein
MIGDSVSIIDWRAIQSGIKSWDVKGHIDTLLPASCKDVL